ncbi:MAG: hypothetical protein AB1428_05825 [Bacteroidota bacterium]
MKLKHLALLFIAAVPLMGFDCITDSFVIALDMKPFNGTYNITPGNNPNYGGSITIDPGTLYDTAYELTGASVYDIRVSTAGPNLGNCSGAVTVNGVLLMTYNGTWTQFNTPQSLLTSRLITRNNSGVTELVNAVVQNRPVVLAVNGSVTTTPVPNGCSLTVSAYVQAYGHLR